MLEDPPATLLVLPNGWVKVAAALPHICADLRRATLAEAWEAYRNAWRDEAVLAAVRARCDDPSHHARSEQLAVRCRLPTSDRTEAR